MDRPLPSEMRGIPLGRYTLGPRLAVGGMGEVYLAVQTGVGRFRKPLALKLLLPHLSENDQAIQMFLQEAQVAARMNHPNVVQIFDVGVASGRHYIAMELVRGVSMSTFIYALKDSKSRVSPALLAYVGRALCDGLHHAHEQVGPDGNRLELVHRDVTPHNILLSAQGDVKLTDFGIAKARDSTSHTRPGFVKGKFEYVAPELLLGAALDRRVDIFGAGITLYHLATLGSPFRRENQMATLQAVEREPLPALSMLRPDLPLPLREAITRATHKDPDTRFQTALELRDALPSATHEAREELAALVRFMCKDAMASLEAKTAHAISGNTHSHTEQLDDGGGEQAEDFADKTRVDPANEEAPDSVTSPTHILQRVSQAVAARSAELADDTLEPSYEGDDGPVAYARRASRRIFAEAREAGPRYGPVLVPPPAHSGELPLPMDDLIEVTRPTSSNPRYAAAGASLEDTKTGRLPGRGRSGLWAKVAVAAAALAAVGAYAALRLRAEPSALERWQLTSEPLAAPPPPMGARREAPSRPPPEVQTPTEAATPAPPPAAAATAPPAERAEDDSPPLEVRPVVPAEAPRGPGAQGKTAGRVGYLTVDAVPWANVYLGGRSIGATPIARLPVEEGVVSLELKNPGTGKTVTRKLKVLRGKPTYVKEDLR